MAKTLGSLTVGQYVKFGKHAVNDENPWSLKWQVADMHPNDRYVTLISEYIIDARCLDAAEPNSSTPNRCSQGNNNYIVSNIDQWLNSRAYTWYTAKHSVDQSPDSSSVVDYGTEYAARPGFLYHFSDLEYNLILNKDIISRSPSLDGGALNTVARRVYLPSLKELGENNLDDDNGYLNEYLTGEGSTFDLFDDEYIDDDFGSDDWTDDDFIAYRECGADSNVINNTKSTDTSYQETYWTRTPEYGNQFYHYYIDYDGSVSRESPNHGGIGVRPVLRVSYDAVISDTLDNDGYYKVITNDPPTTPSSISVPSSIKGGSSVTISWGTSTDPNGDTVKYSLERSVNGGTYSVIYDGTAKSYLDSITAGWNTVQYRVRAYDTNNDYSSYKTSNKVTISNNNTPVISGTDGNLGTKTEGFTTTYSVTDADNNSVTVIEAIDGNTLRSYVVTLGATNTFDVTGETWLTLTNGTHTLTISVNDGNGGTAVRTYQFVKNVYTLSVECDPMIADTMPTRIKLSIIRRVPTGATLKVMVCNNAYDSSPTWEDATDTVINDTLHVFTNTSKTAASWGVAVKVTLARGDAEGSCYIKEIGGNFE